MSSVRTSVRSPFSQFANVGVAKTPDPGRAINLAGDDDHIDLGTGLLTTQDFSLSIWVNVPSLASNNVIFGEGNPYTAAGHGLTLFIDTSGNLVGFMNDGSDGFAGWGTFGATISANAWFLVTLTVDRDANSVLYLNGAAVTGGTVSAVGVPGSLAFGNFYLGKYGAGAIYGFMRQFDFRQYNRVLSPANVATLYSDKQTALIGDADLESHLKLNQQSGTQTDSSGNGHDGIVQNASLVIGDFYYQGADVPFIW